MDEVGTGWTDRPCWEPARFSWANFSSLPGLRDAVESVFRSHITCWRRSRWSITSVCRQGQRLCLQLIVLEQQVLEECAEVAIWMSDLDLEHPA